METAVIIFLVLYVLVMGTLGVRAIRASVSTKGMLEDREYTQIRQKGYKTRRRQLLIRSYIAWISMVCLVVVAIRSVMHLVQTSTYDFARGRAVSDDEWLVMVVWGAVAGFVVSLVVGIASVRRLKAAKVARKLAE